MVASVEVAAAARAPARRGQVVQALAALLARLEPPEAVPQVQQDVVGPVEPPAGTVRLARAAAAQPARARAG